MQVPAELSRIVARDVPAVLRQQFASKFEFKYPEPVTIEVQRWVELFAGEEILVSAFDPAEFKTLARPYPEGSAVSNRLTAFHECIQI